MPASFRFFNVLLAAVLGLTGSIASGQIADTAVLEQHPPEVRQAIERGLALLASGEVRDDRLGAKALIGLSLIKAGAPADHPKVRESVAFVQQSLAEMDPNKPDVRVVYDVALVAIFLLELDPDLYRAEIEQALGVLFVVQKQHGGWGYPHRATGDTSMTQYGVLAMWEAKRAGFNVPQQRIEAVALWLLKTQDPSGAFGYQGKVSPTFDPIPQSEISQSLTAAGLGSLYICADMLGATVEEPEPEDDLPEAVQKVREGPVNRPRATRVNRQLVRRAVDRGNKWLVENWKVELDRWTYYWLYALERYMTFRELTDGNTGPIDWYGEGTAFLLEKQRAQGGWLGQGGAIPDTAFGLLFLMRAMKSSVGDAHALGAGLMIGGRGLPKSTDYVQVRRGRVVARALNAPAEKLLGILDDPEDPDYDQALRQLAEMPAQEARRLFQDRREELRRRLNDPDPDNRLTAVQALAAERRLEHAPWLIAALMDDDLRVVLAGREGLRTLARRPGGMGLPDQPTDDEKLTAMQRWRDWYQAIAPDARFVD